jgi:non-ribosomal peptide synthetase-like protein
VGRISSVAETPYEPTPRAARRRRLHHFFEATCDRVPSEIALEDSGRSVTYRQLDERANQLAHHLCGLGIGSGSRVGILLHRSAQTYVSVLAVLKAGAAFVPIDPVSPQDRVAYICDDSALDLLITSRDLAASTADLGRPLLELDSDPVQAALEARPATRPAVDNEDDPPCYVIYTSGSSGRPKGVEVAQSSICNFISVVPDVYDVRPSDRVYQGMTIAFDFSIEEIWPTFAVGATLVVGPNDSRRLGAELADFLDDTGVTVFYYVPTLLSTIGRDLPAVRSLIVGGEACPAEIVERWSTPGRRILNTYGPTEATVTATWGELVAGRPVTIGRALPTYTVFLLDDDLKQVPDGEVGEICVGGPGVARGYVGRPELTADRFVCHPLVPDGGRLYRTGDLGRLLDNGEIEYLGRADSEVKIRGHRVDLQEIENVLLEDEEIAGAVAALVPAAGSGKELAAYITCRAAGRDDHSLTGRLHAQLCRRLPQYMVPSYLEILDSLPMLPSGKADRASLPAPTGGRFVSTDAPYVPPETPLEKQISAVWAEAFGLDPADVSVEADFFLELGGHSLLAATAVSILRSRNIGRSPALGDVYAHPTVRSLAAHLEAASGQESSAAARPRPTPRRHGSVRVALCGTAQLGFLYALVLLFSLPIAVVYTINGGHVTATVLRQLALALPVVYVGGRWILPVVAGRLLAIGIRPGRYPLWGRAYVRLWAVQKLMEISPVNVLGGSPLLRPYLRLLGARVGRRCHIASGQLFLPTLIHIGDDAVVGYGAHLRPYVVEDGWVTVKPVVVGTGAHVGADSVLLPGARLGEGAALAEHSVAGRDQTIPAGERWAGSPSTRTTAADPVVETMTACTSAAKEWTRRHRRAFAVGLVILELLPFAIVAPGVALVWWWLLARGLVAGLVAAALVGPLYVLTACLVVAFTRRVVLPETPVGIYHLRSDLGVQKWFADKLLETSLATTNSLYATLYTAPWLRLLGARIGSGAEVSTAAHLDPDLLTLGPESFVADMASVGSAAFCNGHVAFRTTEVGWRAFVGNAAFVPSGTRMGDESLVGVHTVPPPEEVPSGSSWLGSPAIYLPKRQDSGSFAEGQTYRPLRRQVAERLVIEFFRVTLPASLFAVSIYLGIFGVSWVAEQGNVVAVVLAAPAAALLAGLAVVVAVAVVKWMVVGRYRPRIEPLWSRFVRRSEFVTGLYEAAAVPALLGALTGTPLLGPMLRLYGARIGRRTWLDTTFLTEFDLVRIGADAAVGTGVSLQTHLFEDRVMKMSVVTIEAGAAVGARSVVLYDAVVGSEVILESLSLVMKGERLTPGTQWRGIPAQGVC